MYSLSHHRLQYCPQLPQQLIHFQDLQPYTDTENIPLGDDLHSHFPQIASQPMVYFRSKENQQQDNSPLKVGVLFSGGPAPGGHNVISGLWDALQKINPACELIGFMNGFEGVIYNRFIPLTEKVIAPFRNQGGFNLIGSGREKVETDRQHALFEKTMKEQMLDALVVIGGDDSNTDAAQLAEYCCSKGIKTSIIGIPKTIDGDLRNEFIEMSFGFDTASKIYSEFIGNLTVDAASAKKYYFFVKVMGRSASHLTLECALQTHVNMALIGEEAAAKNQSLNDIVEQVVDVICERAKEGRNYGVILIPEGLLEFIPECNQMITELNLLSTKDEKLTVDKVIRELSPLSSHCFTAFPAEIQRQLLLDKDPHGNIPLSKIETDRLLIELVHRELDKRKSGGSYSGHFNAQPLFCGYEGRSGLPSNFDCNYCYSLGYAAALFALKKMTGYLCCIKNLSKPVAEWEVFGVPIVRLFHFEMRRGKLRPVIQKFLVDINGSIFKLFEKERGKWALLDEYRCPGPIQFEGPKDLTESITLTLSQKSSLS